MRVLIVVLACLTVTLAQIPVHCVAPTVWRGNLSGFDYETQFARRMSIEYDSANQRVRFIEEDYSNGTIDVYENLFLHETGYHYRINLRTRQCTLNPLSEPFRRFEVPANARFVGEFVIGSTVDPNAGVIIDAWSGIDEYRGGNFTIAVTQTDCIPVFFDHFSESYGFYHSEFYNIMFGVDPGVFVVPSECEQL